MERAKLIQTSSLGLVLSPIALAVPPFRTASVKASKFFLCHGLPRKPAIEARHAGEWRFRKMADS